MRSRLSETHLALGLPLWQSILLLLDLLLLLLLTRAIVIWELLFSYLYDSEEKVKGRNRTKLSQLLSFYLLSLTACLPHCQMAEKWNLDGQFFQDDLQSDGSALEQ